MKLLSESARGLGDEASDRDQLVTKVMNLAPVMRRLFDVRPGPDERATWRSLTVHQLEALVALEGGSLTMRELCERLEISESAGTALSDRLTSHGMVERHADPSDRRVVRVSMSEAARSMVDRYRELKQSRVAEVLSALDDDELAALVRIYETLATRPAAQPEQGTSARATQSARAAKGAPARTRALAAPAAGQER